MILQDVPEQASTIGIDRRFGGRPTPFFRGRLRSAVVASCLSRRGPRVDSRLVYVLPALRFAELVSW